MNTNISDILLKAKDTAEKIINGEPFWVKELEPLLDANKLQLSGALSLNGPEIGDLMEDVIIPATDAFVDYLLRQKIGNSFQDFFINDLLGSWEGSKQLLSSPCQSRSDDDIAQLDDDSKWTLDDLLIKRIQSEMENHDAYNLDALDVGQLQSILSKIETLWDIDDDVKNSIKNAVSHALFGKISPELKKCISEFSDSANKAIVNYDIDFDIKSYKNKFYELVKDVENKTIVRWSDGDKLLQDCKVDFENRFDELIKKLAISCIEKHVVEELEKLDSTSEIDVYKKETQNSCWKVKKMISELNDSNTKKELQDLLDKKIEDARIECLSKPPKVITTIAEDWNEYAVFENEEFPVYQHEKKDHKRRMEPKMLPNWNVLITFRDLTSGTIVEPTPSKRLRYENPYEVSVEDWKEIQRAIKEKVPDALKKIEDLKEKRRKISDKTKEGQEELKKIDDDLKEQYKIIPNCFGVLKRITWLNSSIWNYVEDKIPDFDPATIKITPSIMKNLREIAECAKTMLISQKDILIVEWEAWVWKNVMIDIFAHYTQRPVFVFACWKKTDSHDLTYQRILDENWSKKLNSKIYEAIRTPWAILVLDEINTMDPWTQKRLNALFDKRKELVADEAGSKDGKALKDVLIFGTMNPTSYAWTQKLADDVASRAHFILQDYDWMFNGDVVSYSDALITYWNVNYFWKLYAWRGMTREDLEFYELSLLSEKMGKKLSEKQKSAIKKFKPISDSEFIWAWNKLFNEKESEEVEKMFWKTFIEGMKDIYTIVLYSNFIRVRHKAAKLDLETDFSRGKDEEIEECFREKSFSPRLAIQALEQLNNGNEISSAKDAVIQTYIQQVSDEKLRNKLIEYFTALSTDKIEWYLKNKKVSQKLYAGESK